jgi:hypothetical protein
MVRVECMNHHWIVRGKANIAFAHSKSITNRDCFFVWWVLGVLEAFGSDEVIVTTLLSQFDR